MRMRVLSSGACLAVSLLVGCGGGGGGDPTPGITVTSPNGGETWYFEGPDRQITWTNTAFSGNVDVHYTIDSTGDPATWTWLEVAVDVPNAGSCTWTIANADSSACRVRVQEAGGQGLTDESDFDFTISPPAMTLVAPNGGESWGVGSTQTVAWIGGGFASVRVELTRDGTWTDKVTIAGPVAVEDGSCQWAVTAGGSGSCLVRVSDSDDGVPADDSDAAFTIAEIDLTAPTGGEVWDVSSSQSITWTSSGVANVLIELSRDGNWTDGDGSDVEVLSASTDASAGVFPWTPGHPVSASCLVRISDAGASGAVDASDAPFTVGGITVTAPNGGETWRPGEVREITWASAGVAGNVEVHYSIDGGAAWMVVAASVADSGSYSWTLPGTESEECRVRVREWGGGGFVDESDANFSILRLFTDIGAALTQVDRCSLAWGDYDADGDLDLVLAGYVAVSPFGVCDVYSNDGGVFSATVALTGVNDCSLAWGDYDGDGDLDLAAAGRNEGNPWGISIVYRNDSGTFGDIGAGLADVVDCSLAWGDYDNDGDLDLALAGYMDGDPWQFAEVYRNDPAGFSPVGAGLRGVRDCALAWGDCDNDGDLDLALAGTWHDGTSWVYESKVYGNGGGTFTDIGAGLTGVSWSSLAWGDYDSDGDLDLALMGYYQEGLGSYDVCMVYRNDGWTFVDINAGLTGCRNGWLAWGDYDNDGDLDLAVTDYSAGTWIYGNDGGDAFSDVGAGLEGASKSSLAWGDYDSDGDLDLAVAGSYGPRHSRIYRNNNGVLNGPPAAPGGLSESCTGTGPYDVTFSWTSATDAETPQDGLSYNLRVGTSSRGDDVFSGMAQADGWRKLPARGVAQPGASVNEWTLTLPADTYYWSVQAIDTAFEGSPWAPERTVTVP